MKKKKYIAPEIEVVNVSSETPMLLGESKYNTGTGDDIPIVDDNKNQGTGSSGGSGDDGYDILAKPNFSFNDEEDNGWDSFK